MTVLTVIVGLVIVYGVYIIGGVLLKYDEYLKLMDE